MFSLLYVDDEPGLLEIGKLFLESTGDFSVTTAQSGKEGLAHLTQQGVDAIVSDYQMPEMDGIALLKKVRESHGNIPFILFTGKGREEVVIEAINNGVDFYLQKGGDPRAQFAELVHKIWQAVNRRRAELALFDSEKRLADIINFLPDATFAIDTAGKVIAWNRAIEEMTGVPAGGMLGKGNYEYALPFYGKRRPVLIDLITKPDEKVAGYYSNIRRDAKTLSAETNLPHPKGRQIHVLAKASPLYNREGEISGAIEAIRDITDQKKAEEELRASYEQFAAVNEELQKQYDELRKSEEELRLLKISVDQAADEVFWLDFEGNILYVNDAACRINGYLRDEFLAMKIYDLNPDLTPEIWVGTVTDLRERKTQLFTTRHRHRDGTIIDVEIMAVYVNRNGKEYSFAFVRDITDRKRAEAVLYESEEKYRLISENSPEMIYFIDTGGFIRYVNSVAGKAMQDEPERLIGKHLTEIFRPEVARNHLDAVNQVITTRTSLWREMIEDLPSGRTWIDVRLSPLVDKTGNVIGVLGLSHDISDRKLAEVALVEKEQKNRAIIEQSFQFIGLMTPEGTLIEANRASLAFAGIPESDIINRPFWETPWWSHSQELQEKLKEAIQRAASGETVRFEATHPDADGHLAYFDFSVKPVVDPTGRILYLIPEGRDITERKRAEEALRESESKYRILTELLPQIVFEMDQNFIITFVNQRGYDTLGFTPDDVAKGFNALSVIDPSQHDRIRQNIQKLVAGQPYEHPEYTFTRKDGSTFPGLIYADPIFKRAELAGFRGIIIDITERKIAELALLESEEKYRTLVEVNRDIIYSLCTDGTILYVSPQTITQLGYRPEEMEGRNFTDFIHPDDIGTLLLHIKENFIAGKPIRSDQFRVRRKDGSYRWFEDKTIYATDRQGRPIVAGTIRDITEDKVAHDALRESEEKYKQIFESFVDIYYETDSNGIIRVLSPSVYPLTGWKPEELIGTPVIMLYVNPSDRKRLLDQLEHYHIVSGFEVMLKKRDGTATPVSVNARIRYAADGKTDGVLGSIRDITENIRTRKALEESETRYRNIIEKMQDAYIRTDRDGNLTMVSPSAVQMYGYNSAAEMIVLPAVALHYRPKQRQDLITELQERGRINDFNSEALRKDGSTFWASLSVQFIMDDEGRIQGTEAIVRDITERKRMEHAIRESNRKLNLLSNITRHDMANQLTVVQGFAQLATFSKPEPVVADFLNKISSSAETIQHQIEFARTYQDLGVQAPAWFRIGDVIRSVKPDDIALDCTYDSFEIFADPMVEKVFFNLFDNAMRYGERVTKVTVGCERAGDERVITFTDNGVGIPLDEKQKIFEKGYGRHTGFGLFLAREILAITGISIHETGSHGKGARFEITVPKGAYRSESPVTSPSSPA